MRLAALTAALHLASAFQPQGVRCIPFEKRIIRFSTAHSNDFDRFWEQRRAECDAPALLPLDAESVDHVLLEFVRSDFCKQLFDYRSIQPTDYGCIHGMFESVKLVDSVLMVKLKPAFGETNASLLDRMVRYLRARVSGVREVHVMHRDGRTIY